MPDCTWDKNKHDGNIMNIKQADLIKTGIPNDVHCDGGAFQDPAGTDMHSIPCADALCHHGRCFHVLRRFRKVCPSRVPEGISGVSACRDFYGLEFRAILYVDYNSDTFGDLSVKTTFYVK